MTHSTSGAGGSDGWTRRRVLRVTAVGSVAVGAVGTTSAQDTEETNETERETEGETETEEGEGETTPETTFEFGGRTDGWEGRSPGRIEGETNPALNLTAGTDYVVAWENLDGEEHDFVIRDDAGEEIESTDSSDEEGETLSLSFTATGEMVSYVCSYHQDTMSGEVSVQGDGTTAEGETTGGETTGEETNGEETGDEGTTEGDDNEIAAGTPGQQEETTIVGPDQTEPPAGEGGEGGGGDGAESDQPGFGALAALAALAAVAASRLLGDGEEE